MGFSHRGLWDENLKKVGEEKIQEEKKIILKTRPDGEQGTRLGQSEAKVQCVQ